MSLESLVMLGLATHEAVNLWFNGSIFQALRRWLSARHAILREGVNCPTCMSVWGGALMLACWFVPYARVLVWLLAAIDLGGLVQVLTTLTARAPMVAYRNGETVPR